MFEKFKYKIIENPCPSKALWWRAFGFPARLNEDNQWERIEGFISCTKCMKTHIYNKLSGTKHFKEHADKCFPLSETSEAASSSSSSSTQVTLNQIGFTKSRKFNEKDIKKIKDLSVEWVCGGIRPFSILDDSGFRRLAQECVRLGANCGAFDVYELLRGEKTISRHVTSFAAICREQIKELLSNPLKEHSITICPDYWIDPYKKISYLGVSVIIVDDEYCYTLIDLCCKPSEYERKTAEYTLKVGINICIKEEAGVTLHQSCIVRWLSMINLLESVLQTFKTTKRLLLARNKQSLIHDLDVLTIKQLVLVLKPVKHVVTVVQTGNSPSLHLVLLCNLTLKRALSSYESLLDYVNTYCNQNDKPSNKWEHEENENYESEGIKWFRERLLLLIDELFNLDVRHYCATMLHPKYKLLKSCTIEERSQCHQYIRRQLNILHDTNLRHKSHEPSPEPQQKKIKIS
ncbi:unnamed protein product [Rotaria sp. Silwood1]|nr:unnamed protein product [Rotaria sp. Silwood1]